MSSSSAPGFLGGALASSLGVPTGYGEQGAEAGLHAAETALRDIVAQRRLPEQGWSVSRLRWLMSSLAEMDSNTFAKNVGVGEREGRVFSQFVSERNFQMAHGIGRSGDIAAPQPKAAGSSILARLATLCVADALKIAGLNMFDHPKPPPDDAPESAKRAFAQHSRKRAIGVPTDNVLVLPVATGMALTLVLLTLSQKRRSSDKSVTGQFRVIQPRIDQKTCVKCIVTAGCEPQIIENVFSDESDELRTDLAGIEAALQSTESPVLCVMTTVSCFAPRATDRVVEVAELCQRMGVAHVVNCAYGIQSRKIMNLVSEATRLGRVDAIVCSTDKNFLVPVGGAVVFSPDQNIIRAVAQIYPGRASSSPSTDLLCSLLEMGRSGWEKLLAEREELFPYLRERLVQVAEKAGERVLSTPHNTISIAMTVNFAAAQPESSTFFGAMLFRRLVSGTRVVPTTDVDVNAKPIAGLKFRCWGAHSSVLEDRSCKAFLTAAAAIGGSKAEVDEFCLRLEKCIAEFRERPNSSSV